MYTKFHDKTHLKYRRGNAVFEIIRTFLMMNLIRATDLFADVGEYFRKIGSLTYNFNFHVISDGTLMNLGIGVKDYIILGCGVLMMLSVSLIQEKGNAQVRSKIQVVPRILRYAIIFAMLLAVILFGHYGIGYDASNFIYNQF